MFDSSNNNRPLRHVTLREILAARADGRKPVPLALLLDESENGMKRTTRPNAEEG